MVNAYLPKEWALVLVGLSSTISAIIEEGFKGIQILSFDDNIKRSMRLTEWVRQYDDVVFQFPAEESDHYESKNDMAQKK